MRADLSIRLRRLRDGSVRASGDLATPPLWCRWNGSTLWIVSSAASPVGTDDVGVTLVVGAGVTATVRTVAATMVYAGVGEGTRFRTHLVVDHGATLRWQPEPVILTARAVHRSEMLLEVDPDATLLADEVVALGRSGERAGSLATRLDLRIGGVAATLTGFDTSVPCWDGPGGVGGARVVGTRVLVGDDAELDGGLRSSAGERHVVLRPERGGALATVLCDRVDQARTCLDEVLRPPQTVIAARTSSSAASPPSPLPVMRPDSST